MRVISDDAAPTQAKATKSNKEPSKKTFSTIISDGREIVIREMTGRDLVFLEKELSKMGDAEKGMKVIERLVVGEEKITYEEMLDLGVRDFRKLSELVAKANGDEKEEDKEDEDPN